MEFSLSCTLGSGASATAHLSLENGVIVLCASLVVVWGLLRVARWLMQD